MKYYMDKKKIEDIVENCYRGIDEAEVEMKKLSEKEIIELKAKLKGKSACFDKWGLIFMPFIAIAIAALSVIISASGVDKNLIDKLACGLLVVALITLVVQTKEQHKKEKVLVALSYLENYANLRKKTESYEQIEKRQKEERKQSMLMNKLIRWKRK